MFTKEIVLNTEKKLQKYGVAAKDYQDMFYARGETYTRSDQSFPSTNLACQDNPYIEQLKTSKYILDFGCGVGRNLSWIMNNTDAKYIGLDPNTDMLKYFWEVQKYEGYDITGWVDRVSLYSEFKEIPTDIKFDYVVSTFVLQHLGYRYINFGLYNLTDITQNIFSRMSSNGVFFALEHDYEERWIERWIKENNIKLDVYIRSYKGLPELTDRDYLTIEGHHLMIFKKPE